MDTIQLYPGHLAARTSVRHLYKKGEYIRYADGDITNNLFRFTEMLMPWDYNDKVTWDILCKHIGQNNAKKIVDVGCGPGTWAFRIAQKFPSVRVTGFDVSEELVEEAKELQRGTFPNLADRVTFYVGDACNIHAADQSYDMSLCLHSVLNHIPEYGEAVRELRRVSRSNISSMHAIYGPPTFITIPPEDVLEWGRKDNWMVIKTRAGEEHSIYFALLTSTDIHDLFSRYFRVRDMLGIDILATKNLGLLCGMNPGVKLNGHLDDIQSLEDRICRDDRFMDHAKNIMVISD